MRIGASLVRWVAGQGRTRASIAVIALSLSVVLSGFGSKPPTLTANELARPPDLAGEYTQTMLGGSSGQSTVRVTAGDDGSYRFTTLSANGASATSNAETFRLLELGERSYLLISDERNSVGQVQRVIYQSFTQERDGAWLLRDMKLEPDVTNIDLGFITENLKLAAKSDRGTVEVFGQLTAESLREFFTDVGVAMSMTEPPSRRYVRTSPRAGAIPSASSPAAATNRNAPQSQ